MEMECVQVARFFCTRCRLTVSMLPMSVLPYRNRLVEAVDRYFRAGRQERSEMGDGDLLRRYWRAVAGALCNVAARYWMAWI